MDYILIGTLIFLALYVVFRLFKARKAAKRSSMPVYHVSETPLPEIIAETKPATVTKQYFTGAKSANPEVSADSTPTGLRPGYAPPQNAGIPNQQDTEKQTAEISEDPHKNLIQEIMNYGASTAKRIFAIQEVGKLRLDSATSPLIEALYDPDPDISAAAASSLGKIGNPLAIAPLLEVIQKNDEKLMSEVPPESQSVKREGGESALSLQTSSASDSSFGGDPEANPFKYKEMTLVRMDLLPKEYLQPDGSPVPRKELVVRGLKDNDQQLRKIAAKAAIGMEDPDLVPALIETMNNPGEIESVRYLAAEALGGFHDDRTVAPLIEALHDENVAVRYSAAAALSKCDDKKVIDALVSALSDPNEFVRSSVAYALGHINNPRSMQALLLALEDDQEVVRFSVAKALGTIGGDTVLNGLKERMEKAEGRFKTAVVEALGHLKDDRTIGLLRAALRDQDSEVAFRASLALMNQDSIEALDDLVEASRRLDQELMEWAGVETGGKVEFSTLADNQTVSTTSTNKKGKGKGVTQSVPKFESKTGKAPSAATTTQQRPLSAQGKSAERAAATSAKPSAKQTPQPSSKPEDQKTAAAPITENPDQAIEKLRTALSHPSPNVRGCAINALGGFANKQARDLLVNALLDTHEYVRATSISSLARMNDPSVLKDILTLADDEAEEVRYALAKSLGRFRDESASTCLHKLAEGDKSRDVRRAARLSLESMTTATPD
ncbi:MAG: HEAT repeat domain-containing protein [Candidatus Riflebacteria bacterium]|nr:HEAT repeat domain-containing protein [Candidatus Riflebacteria bacterium]